MRRLRKLFVFLVVIAVLLIAADRIGDVVAERITASNLQSSQHLDQRPDVDIDGIPFLTQFASGNYQHVAIDARNVRIGSTPLYLANLHTDFNQVTVSHDFTKFHANSATANATVGYASLGRALHIRVRYAGNGRIEASKKITVLGRTITPTVRVKVRYANGALRFGKSTINGLGALGDEASRVLDALGNPFGDNLRLRDIPFEISVRSLRLDAAGLELALVGSDLSYDSNMQS